MAKRGPQTDPWRDVCIYRLVSELRRSRRSKLRAVSDAEVILAREWQIHLSIPGLWAAYVRGEKLSNQDSRTWVFPRSYERPRKSQTGRPTNPDVVRDVIIYDLVAKALKQGHSLRQSFRIASNDDWATGHKPSNVRAVYEKMKRLYSKKASR